MLGTGYFLKIAKINSQQEKPICPYCKSHTKSPICKNELPQKISCHTVGLIPSWTNSCTLTVTKEGNIVFVSHLQNN